MAYKLKNLLITNVDFVDAGANQRANILITKKAQEGGEQDMTPENKNPVTKFLSSIAKKLGFSEKDVADSIAEIAKGEAMTFNDAKAKQDIYRVYGEIDDVCWALQNSLRSILEDDDVADKISMMKQSVDEFSASVKGCADSWGAKKPAGISKKNPEAPAEDPAPENKDVENTSEVEKNKEDNVMEIDKSLLTPAELAFLEEIEKKAMKPATDKADEVEKKEQVADNPTPEEKTEESVEKKVQTVEVSVTADDIFKSLPEKLSNVLKGIEEKMSQFEDKELTELAKKYEILGVKTEDMVPMLKSIKDNKAVYDAVIKRFDDAVAAIESSGIFAEVGKRGKAESTDDAWNKIEKHAEEIIKSHPDMDYHKAVDMACQQHPELVREYENA
ncbi:hypothetical protein [Anaerovibrio sp. RM50]|uniref:hypothetical protein n=1 Tax=Anaerovibrio sp. RM50 TaxID=1200557 RepID=UPI0004811A3F|nr:hypothetical protein [Anaerovibrio sp. RM50]